MALKNFTSPPTSPPPTPVTQTSQHTNEISDLVINYNERFASADPTLYRDQVINQTLSTLIGKEKPNALLIGAAGVGKTRIVEDIARRIEAKDSLIPHALASSTIYELPLSALIAGAGIVGELESRLTAIVDYFSDPDQDAILFIDEIHQLTKVNDSTYSRIAQIIKPALARGHMRVIGATTLQEARAFDDDPAFSRRFTRVIVDELTKEQTTEVLHKATPSLLLHYNSGVQIANDVLNQVVEVAERTSHRSQHRPDNALTLLDRAMAETIVTHASQIAHAEAEGNTTLAQILKTTTPQLSVRKLEATAKRLMTGNATEHIFNPEELETALMRLKGQEKRMHKLIEQLKRQQLKLFPQRTPTAWLFAGASGCGKTEAAKIIASHLTGLDPIVLNMTEYNHSSSLTRIIGSPPGYVGSNSNAELPFDSLESNPYRVILLDEFEKADKAIQRLFLSALDEGVITTAAGKVVDFSKTLIIATTNAAREALGHTPLGFTSQQAAPELSEKQILKELKHHYDAELLGRFTMIIGFNPLTEAIYREILVDTYARERERVCQLNPHYSNRLDEDMPNLEHHVHAFNADIGARPAKRAVRLEIENQLM